MPKRHIPTTSILAKSELGFERIVFFSDAVMAIVITLLVIDIKVPDLEISAARSELYLQLTKLTPQIISFVISFVVIGVYWISHHRYFSLIHSYDYRLISLNLLFLFFITLVPFIASLLGKSAYLPISVIAYAADVAAIGLSLGAMWWYASYTHRLVDKSLDPGIIRQMNVRAFVAPLIFLLSIPLAFINPRWAFVAWWLSPIIVLASLRIV